MPRTSRVALVVRPVLLVAVVALSACSSGVEASRDAATDVAGGGRDGGGTDAREDARLDAHKDGPVDAGPPTLVVLDVTGAAGGLVPAFSPNVHDYYVPCAAGSNRLTVTMTASPGAESALAQPTTSPPAPSQTVAVSAKESDALVATATRGTASTAYWVRCLPHDFPPIAMTAYPDAGAPSPGYYLLGNAVVPAGESGYAMLLDVNGVPVWYHGVAAGLAVSDVDSIVPGTIPFIPTSFIAYDPFEIEQLQPLQTTQVSPTGYTPDEHDLRALPNGNFLMFSYVTTPGVDLTGLSIPLPDDAGVVPLGPDSTIQDCTVLEVDPAGNVVWTWSANAHFDPVKVSTFAQTGFGPDAILADGGISYDVYHCTAIDVDPANGNILVSSRGMSSVFYVERPGGRVLWKMGGVNSSLDNATYVSVADPFSQEHDGRLLPGWSETCNGGTGQVSVFDDESTTGNPARAAIYDVVVGGADGGCGDAGGRDAGTPGQARLAWEYKGTAGSGGAGSVRIEPDGSRIIGWGLGVPVFTEVDVDGHKLLELTFPDGGVSYRAIKLPLSAFDLGVLRSTAGQ